MKVFLKSVAIAAACFTAGALAVAFDSTMRVTLESKNGGKTTRWIGDIRSVRLDRTLSDRPCREGRNWGYDRNRLWVDDGCRATFTVRRGDEDDRNRGEGRGRGNGKGNGNGRGRGNGGDWNWNDSSRLERETVKIESSDGKHKSRVISHVGRVTLLRRLSDRPCIEGRTWGYTDSSIWVDRGCRAEFEYYRRR